MNPPTILVLSNTRDFAADVVIRRLGERGARVRRLNIESARRSPVPTWNPDTGLSNHRPHVVWWRQFEEDIHHASVDDVDDILVERAQWRTWISSLYEPGVEWVNDLWAARRAESKIEQLRVAQRVGLQVPPTTVTNDRSHAADFASRVGEVVVKTLSSAYFAFSDQSFVFTESFDHPALADEKAWSAAPLIVQRRLAGALDARVVSFGNTTVGAQCAAQGLDWRKTPFTQDLWSVWDVPAATVDGCRRYRDSLGLHYAAFDFMILEGQPFFLEANQAGEWLFLDKAIGSEIGTSLADHLLSLAVEVASR